jgi:amino acid transporter
VLIVAVLIKKFACQAFSSSFALSPKYLYQTSWVLSFTHCPVVVDNPHPRDKEIPIMAQASIPSHPDSTQIAPVLEGKMGTVKLVLTVLALSAPLGAVAGVVPIVIGTGNGVGAPSTYLLVGVIMLLFAVGFTTLARHLPSSGAFYSFISVGLSRPLGLGSAFIAMLGYLALLLGAYGFLGISLNNLLVERLGLMSLPWWTWSLVALGAVTVLGHFNVELSGRVLSVLMVLEVAIVLCLDIPAIATGGAEGITFEPFTFSAFTSGSLGLALLFAVANFLGFESTALYRREVRNPSKTVPRATYLSVILIAVFYTMSSWALVIAFGSSTVVSVATSDPTTMFSTALGLYTGPLMQDIFGVLLITSVFASLLATHNPIARYLYSLARDTILPRQLGMANPKHGSPSVASMTTSIVALVSALPFVVANLDVVSFFSWMFGIGAYALLILMALTCLTVVVYFRRNQSAEPFWNVVAAPTLGFLGLGGLLVVVSQNFALLIGGSAELALLFQGITWGVGLLGVIVALYWRRSDPARYGEIGGTGEEVLLANPMPASESPAC